MLVTVGRDVECSVVMDSPRVSGRHCQIRFFADRFEVTDLGSSNGTFVGFERRRVQGTVTVYPGQPLFLGSIEVSPSEVARRCGLRWPEASPAGAYPGRAVAAAPTLLEGRRLNYAGFWKRFAAIWLDGLVLAVVNIASSRSAPQFTGRENLEDILEMSFSQQSLPAFFASVLIGWLYSAIMVSSPQQGTLGKMALGIRVTDINGQRVSFATASGRHFAQVLSSIPCCGGYFMAAFTEKKQTLHDLMAGTLVLEKR